MPVYFRTTDKLGYNELAYNELSYNEHVYIYYCAIIHFLVLGINNTGFFRFF